MSNSDLLSKDYENPETHYERIADYLFFGNYILDSLSDID